MCVSSVPEKERLHVQYWDAYLVEVGDGTFLRRNQPLSRPEEKKRATSAIETSAYCAVV